MTDSSLAELRERQDAEYKALVSKKHTRRELRRMAVRHVNEFCRFTKRQIAAEIRARK
jgi:hypothetical protein